MQIAFTLLKNWYLDSTIKKEGKKSFVRAALNELHSESPTIIGSFILLLLSSFLFSVGLATTVYFVVRLIIDDLPMTELTGLLISGLILIAIGISASVAMMYLIRKTIKRKNEILRLKQNAQKKPDILQPIINELIQEQSAFIEERRQEACLK